MLSQIKKAFKIDREKEILSATVGKLFDLIFIKQRVKKIVNKVTPEANLWNDFGADELDTGELIMLFDIIPG